MSLGRSTTGTQHPLDWSGSDDIYYTSTTASMSLSLEALATKAGSRATSRAASPDLPSTPPNSPERPNDIDFDLEKRPTTMKNNPQVEPAEKGFLKIRGVQHSRKARPLSGYFAFSFFEERTKKTNHPIDIVPHKKTKHVVKHNPNNSPISELEAAAWAHYHLLVPNVVPTSSRAYYNADGDYVAVSSRMIKHFQSFKVRPLTRADLQDETIVKSLAECLTASYIFKEDDLHLGNIGVQCDKHGTPLRVVRIDFDMSLWPILKDHKQSSATDYTLRKIDTTHFVFAEIDITRFPYLKHCKPFYWPTHTLLFPDTVTAYFSANAYTASDATFFRELSSNETFKFYQYQTMIKYALMTPDMFRHEIEECIREDLPHSNGRPLIDVLVEYQAQEIETLKRHLMNINAFGNLFYTHSQQFLENILADFKKRNAEIDLKIAKSGKNLSHLKIDLDDFRKRFNEFSSARQYKTVVANTPTASHTPSVKNTSHRMKI